MLILHLVVLTICVVVIENASSTIGMVHDFVRSDFPADFVFGAATSANQEDIQLMTDMGLEAYRFSISCSRLIPNVRGSINLKGLRYYNNVINEIVAHDLPQVLEDEYDGWLIRKSIENFVAYNEPNMQALFGDRVLYWTTFNEPNMQALFGYNDGVAAPGRCSYPFGNCTNGNSTEPYIMGHNMLLAHASVATLYRTKYKVTQHGVNGIDLYAAWYEPNADVYNDSFGLYYVDFNDKDLKRVPKLFAHWYSNFLQERKLHKDA